MFLLNAGEAECWETGFFARCSYNEGSISLYYYVYNVFFPKISPERTTCFVGCCTRRIRIFKSFLSYFTGFFSSLTLRIWRICRTYRLIYLWHYVVQAKNYRVLMRDLNSNTFTSESTPLLLSGETLVPSREQLKRIPPHYHHHHPHAENKTRKSATFQYVFFAENTILIAVCRAYERRVRVSRKYFDR